MSVLNHTCNICYSNDTHYKLKCNTCKHNVCNDCFSNILFNTDKFNKNYMDDITNFKCPYCTNITTFTLKKLNNLNINDKLVKLLIKKSHDNANDFDEHKKVLIDGYNVLSNQVNVLQKLLYESDSIKEQYKTIINKLKLKLQKMNDESDVKYEKIVNVVKNTKQKSTLYNEINSIIHGK